MGVNERQQLETKEDYKAYKLRKHREMEQKPEIEGQMNIFDLTT